MTSSHMSWRIVQSCCHTWVKTILKLLLNFLEFPSFQSKQERKEIIYPVGKIGSLTFKVNENTEEENLTRIQLGTRQNITKHSTD